MLRDIAHLQDLLPADRANLVFSDATKIRNPGEVASGVVILKKGAAGYPLTADIYVKGPLFSPSAARQWVAIDAEYTTPKNAKNVAVTSLQWRLGSTLGDYWWTAGAWTLGPAAGQWNTLEEVQDNLAAFPTANGIRFIANLQTTDSKLTPTLEQVRFLYRAEMTSFLVETVLGGLVAAVRDATQPESEMSFAWPGGVTVNLGTILAQEKEPLTIAGVTGAFDYNTDPDLGVNLKSSYNTGTKVLTLTADPGEGTMVVVRLLYTPSVMVATHSDYDEIARVPAVALRDVNESLLAHPPGKIGFVNRSDGSGWTIRRPRQVDVRVKLVAIASRLGEATALGESLKRLIVLTRKLHLASLDVDVGLVLEDDLVIIPGLTDKHLHEAAIAIRLFGMETFLESAQASQAVVQVDLTSPVSGKGMNVVLVKD